MGTACRMLFLFFCFIACPCSVMAAEQKASPFAATGHLPSPSETAEDILLRAHKRDARAMAFVAIGYAKGIGGFPKDVYLARTWGKILYENNAPGLGAFVALLLLNDISDQEMNIGLRLAQCEQAQDGKPEILLKKFAQFDVKQYCATLEERKPSHSEWEKEYEEAMEFFNNFEKTNNSAINLMRSLRSRQPTVEEEQFLLQAWSSLTLETLIFYAATTHVPGKEVPDWNAERLLLFLDTCRNVAAQPKSNKEQSPFAAIIPAVNAALAAGLTQYPENIRQDLHMAHNVPPLPALSSDQSGIIAMRKMAQYYRNGVPGFMKHEELAQAWLLSAAMDDDPQSTLLLALELFSAGSVADAWHWAMTVTKHTEATPEAKRIGELLIKKAEKLRPKGLTSVEIARIEGYRKAKEERLQWRISHTDG